MRRFKMSKLITALFAGALFGSSYVALAVEAQPMEESTHPNSVSDVPVEKAQQKPDRAGKSATTRSSRSGMEYSDREYMDRWSESNTGGTGSVGGRGTGTNNPNSNADMSGSDQIERGNQGDVEKLRQKPQQQ
jgi:hypothetical protein